jgi:hypothetical protein
MFFIPSVPASEMGARRKPAPDTARKRHQRLNLLPENDFGNGYLQS